MPFKRLYEVRLSFVFVLVLSLVWQWVSTARGASKQGSQNTIQQGWGIGFSGPVGQAVWRFFNCVRGKRCRPNKVFNGEYALKKWAGIKHKIGRHKNINVRFLPKIGLLAGKTSSVGVRRKLEAKWKKRWGQVVQKLARGGYDKKALLKLGKSRGWVKAKPKVAVALVEVQYRMFNRKRSDIALMVLRKKRTGWRLAFWEDDPKHIVGFLLGKKKNPSTKPEISLQKNKKPFLNRLISVRKGAPGAKDRDGDGIADRLDKCPDDPEDLDNFQDSDGCPDPDNDIDGIADTMDKCPNHPETYNGYKDKDGCPDRAPVKIHSSPKIKAGFYFSRGSTKLLSISQGRLRATADVMKKYKTIKLVEVGGFADDYRCPKKNRRLSRRRALTVRRMLIKAGVQASRLKAKGYGLPKNVKKGGRERSGMYNRRVVLKILKKR